MSASIRLRPAIAPITLLAQVWRVGEFVSAQSGLATGHTGLDAQLPGAGWPLDGMVEVLQERGEQHVWQLLLPVLAQATRQRAGPVVLVGAPFQPFGPSLAAQGLRGDRLLCIHTDKATARLWATEQALRCADVLAVLAWLPQAKNNELRRLHMAAQQNARLLFVFRGLAARHEASPARLRLLVDGVDGLNVHILKRRGPPLETPVVLPDRPVRLAALLESRQGRGPVAPLEAPSTAVPVGPVAPVAAPLAPAVALSGAAPALLFVAHDERRRRTHALDRLAAVT